MLQIEGKCCPNFLQWLPYTFYHTRFHRFQVEYVSATVHIFTDFRLNKYGLPYTFLTDFQLRYMFQQSSDCSLNVYCESKVAGQVVAPIIFVS